MLQFISCVLSHPIIVIVQVCIRGAVVMHTVLLGVASERVCMYLYSQCSVENFRVLETSELLCGHPVSNNVGDRVVAALHGATASKFLSTLADPRSLDCIPSSCGMGIFRCNETARAAPGQAAHYLRSSLKRLPASPTAEPQSQSRSSRPYAGGTVRKTRADPISSSLRTFASRTRQCPCLQQQ